MKSWITLIVLAVGLTAVATVGVTYLSADTSKGLDFELSAGSTDPNQPVPTVQIDQDLTHQFGLLPQKVVGNHTWTFKNIGQGNLELTDAGTDCQCTVAQIGKLVPGPDGKFVKGKPEPIPPGGSEPVALTWKTNESDGRYRKTAKIATNDPRNPIITLVVEGMVRPSITLYPPGQTVNFKTVSNDEPVTQRIALYSGDYPLTKVVKLECSTPALIGAASKPLTPEECKMLKIDSGVAIELTIKPTANLGSFAEEVVVTLDHPTKPDVRLKLLGKVTGPITTVPEKVLLRNVNAAKGASEELVLWARGQNVVKFEVVKKPAGLDVSFDPIPQAAEVNGSKYRMVVKVLPGTAAGVILDEILIKTDHPKAAEVRVPVDILVEAAR